MPVKNSRFDAADYLETEADIVAYLRAALEENDPVFFQKALGTAVRSRGMQAVSERARTTRAGLYKALGPSGNPEFATVFRVVEALGLRFTLTLAQPRRPLKPKARLRPRSPSANHPAPPRKSSAATTPTPRSRKGL